MKSLLQKILLVSSNNIFNDVEDGLECLWSVLSSRVISAWQWWVTLWSLHQVEDGKCKCWCTIINTFLIDIGHPMLLDLNIILQYRRNVQNCAWWTLLIWKVAIVVVQSNHTQYLMYYAWTNHSICTPSTHLLVYLLFLKYTQCTLKWVLTYKEACHNCIRSLCFSWPANPEIHWSLYVPYTSSSLYLSNTNRYTICVRPDEGSS